MMADEYLPIFVYGTLQRGEERSGQWPHPPVTVQRATMQGIIRDLGAYPALSEGEGTVLGELWTVELIHFRETLRVLDEIECCGQEDVDLYVRRIVSCTMENGEQQRAHAYYFADPQAIYDKPLVSPDEHGVSHWRRHRRSCSA